LFLSPVDGLDHKASLAVLDTETLEITDYCVEVEVSDEWIEGWPPAPIWSPDGKQILVVDQQELYYSQVIWVDLENGVSARMGKDKGAAGWMLAPGE
jgi:Tol biopolymer transport system component